MFTIRLTVFNTFNIRLLTTYFQTLSLKWWIIDSFELIQWVGVNFYRGRCSPENRQISPLYGLLCIGYGLCTRNIIIIDGNNDNWW